MIRLVFVIIFSLLLNLISFSQTNIKDSVYTTPNNDAYTKLLDEVRESKKYLICEEFLSRYSKTAKNEDIIEVKTILAESYKVLADTSFRNYDLDIAETFYKEQLNNCTNEDCKKYANNKILIINKRKEKQIVAEWVASASANWGLLFYNVNKFKFFDPKLLSITNNFTDDAKSYAITGNITAGGSYIKYYGKNKYQAFGFDYNINFSVNTGISEGYDLSKYLIYLRLGVVVTKFLTPYVRINALSFDKLTYSSLGTVDDDLYTGTIFNTNNQIIFSPGIRINIPISDNVELFGLLEGVVSKSKAYIAQSITGPDEYSHDLVVSPFNIRTRYSYWSFGIKRNAIILSIESYNYNVYNNETSNKMYYQNSIILKLNIIAWIL